VIFIAPAMVQQALLLTRFVKMKVLRAIKILFCFQLLSAMFLIVPASWAENPPSAESSEAQQVVARLHEALIKAMRESGSLGYKGRYELLAPVIGQTHDLDFIARTSLGANWTQLSPEQQQTFIDVFRKLSIGTYAGWFKDYDGERFEFVEQQQMPREQVMVRSKLVPLKGEPVRFDYILRHGKEGWRIVNILADGVSDLALKRVEYRAILQRDGFPTLIDMLRKKIALTEQS
jgi:phospholipid transport system substrate-binding protein